MTENRSHPVFAPAMTKAEINELLNKMRDKHSIYISVSMIQLDEWDGNPYEFLADFAMLAKESVSV